MISKRMMTNSDEILPPVEEEEEEENSRKHRRGRGRRRIGTPNRTRINNQIDKDVAAGGDNVLDVDSNTLPRQERGSVPVLPVPATSPPLTSGDDDDDDDYDLHNPTITVKRRRTQISYIRGHSLPDYNKFTTSPCSQHTSSFSSPFYSNSNISTSHTPPPRDIMLFPNANDTTASNLEVNNTPQNFSQGDLVWAKCSKRSPAWPAIVIDPLCQAPQAVLKARVPKTICVMFYGYNTKGNRVITLSFLYLMLIFSVFIPYFNFYIISFIIII